MKRERKNLHSGRNMSSVSISLASPKEILSWSFGEVVKAETINYRTQKPEVGGLSDERIFGPEKDYQCSCGKYIGVQYKNFVCDKCHVGITKSSVRRERMGHITLAVPVAHTWYLRKIPYYISMVSGLPIQSVQKVVDFAAYLVTNVSEVKKKEYTDKLKQEIEKQLEKADRKETQKKLKGLYNDRVKELNSVEVNEIMSEERYFTLEKRFPGLFEVGIGSEAIHNMFVQMDLKKKEKELIKAIEMASKANINKLHKHLSIVRSFIKNDTRPEWMFLTVLPVLPPGLRPMVALDGGRYACSDLNDLYRTVINRNNRLKGLMEINAPEVILRNEKRILQEAVDALLDNSVQVSGSSSNVMSKNRNRVLKSLAEYLHGKQGYFRANLLGKRVDYSGRSVIVIGPHLKMDECGIPKEMALELFRPYVIAELTRREIAYNMRNASRMVEDKVEEVWDALDHIIKGKYILLNRQPTLYRLGIQAFKPILIEGIAIELHPLVCKAFNSDFDGDQMAVYVPLTDEAQSEAKNIIASKKNIINPASGEIVASPNVQDIVLGCYWITTVVEKAKGSGNYYSSPNEAIAAYENGALDIRSAIKLLPGERAKYKAFKGELFETTVGRLLLNSILPDDMVYINKQLSKKDITELITNCIHRNGVDETIPILDAIKDFGFKYATLSGTTFAWTDLGIPSDYDKKIEDGWNKLTKNYDFYRRGLITQSERKRINIENWISIRDSMKESILDSLGDKNPIKDIILSGARGNVDQLNQMSGMVGIISSASGEPIEHPITSSYKYGLNSIEYFINSYGTRKGLSDTALKTADAGYLSRKAFDVAQEVNMTEKNCGTTKGFNLFRSTASDIEISFANRIKGRFAMEDVVNKKGGVLVKRNEMITDEVAKVIEKDLSIEVVCVRSPLGCKNKKGVCQKCYGNDIASGELIDLGEPVGTIAALSVGEPGTQLTMRTFHHGGVLSIGGDITSGLPRVIELFDKRNPKAAASISEFDGTVMGMSKTEEGLTSVTIEKTKKKETEKSKVQEYIIPANRQIKVKKKDEVKKGQMLTDGSANLDELFELAGKEIVQKYIFDEITKIYELQGVELAPVHFEVIIKQMFTRRQVVDPGDSTYTIDDIVEESEMLNVNDMLKEKGKAPMKTKDLIFGIVNIPKSRSNFLSSASFQGTKGVILSAAIRGAEDVLDDLKSNVMIGRLAPIGTGFKGSKKYEMIQKVQERIQAEKDLEEEKNKSE